MTQPTYLYTEVGRAARGAPVFHRAASPGATDINNTNNNTTTTTTNNNNNNP